jgi:uroporphyrinogen III methyltransferase/synthase
MSIVYLIGAGPGDPGLITVRGMQCLASADVVLYDHLVNPRLLRYARPDAEKIDLGNSAPQPLQQEAICYLLAEKAREGKTVARLKWGDPYVFDTGGAEGLFLHEQGVRFEVVPGVPVSIAAPAYAGVPTTYPGGGDTLTVIRGFEDEGKAEKEIDVDWAGIARLDGTLICYAGPQQQGQIVRALLAHGRPGEEPAALIFDGTLPTQRTLDGTLAQLLEALEKSPSTRPAVLVVGRVAALREHLRWYDERPLFGKRVLVTRPRGQAAEFVERLEAMGAEVVEAALIRIEPPEDMAAVDDACAKVGTFNWIVFSSQNAVDGLLGRLFTDGDTDARILGGVKLCCVGTATRDRLAKYGLKADLVPDEYNAEGMVRALSAVASVAGLRILIPHADIGRELVADELRRQGADVTEIIAYRTVATDAEREGDPDIYRMLLERTLDIVTFTSPSAVRNLVRVLGAEPAADLLRTTIVASIGPVTAEAASQSGIETHVMPEKYTVPALVQAIVKHVEGRS